MKKSYSKAELAAMKERELRRLEKRSTKRKIERLQMIGLTYKVEADRYEEGITQTVVTDGDKRYYKVKPLDLSDEEYHAILSEHKDIIAEKETDGITYLCNGIGIALIFTGMVFGIVYGTEEMLFFFFFMIIGLFFSGFFFALGRIIKYLNIFKIYEELK